METRCLPEEKPSLSQLLEKLAHLIGFLAPDSSPGPRVSSICNTSNSPTLFPRRQCLVQQRLDVRLIWQPFFLGLPPSHREIGFGDAQRDYRSRQLPRRLDPFEQLRLGESLRFATARRCQELLGV